MPKSGVLLLLSLIVGAGVVLGRSDPPPPGVRPPIDGPLVAPPSGADRGSPIVQLGDRGWLERTLTVASDAPATGPIEVVVELRLTWSDGAGHVRVTGWETNGRYEEVITDEPRVGADLDASLDHYQRMLDELRASGGSVMVVDGVTVAHQWILTPDGEAEDVWRIGVEDPEW